MDSFFDFVLNLDRHLRGLVRAWHHWTYLLLFAVLFVETGFIVTNFLPGDSICFAAGAVAAQTSRLHIGWLLAVLWAATFAADQLNYAWGRGLGRRLFTGRGRLINDRRLEKARDFYRRHGVLAILYGRFVPVVRALVPFSAAVSGMQYRRFLPLSLLGTALWTAVFTGSGYFFGNIPWVRENFILAMGVAVAVSFLPALIALRKEKRREPSASRPRRSWRPRHP